MRQEKFQSPLQRPGASVLCSTWKDCHVPASGTAWMVFLELDLTLSNKPLMVARRWDCGISRCLPFTCVNWFLFLSLAEVRGDFLNTASVLSCVPPATCSAVIDGWESQLWNVRGTAHMEQEILLFKA